MENFLSLPLTPSCRDQTLAAFSILAWAWKLQGVTHLLLPTYPLSASTFSPEASFLMRSLLNIDISFHTPGKNGPFIQTMLPPNIDTDIS